jgi:hypothetical protein
MGYSDVISYNSAAALNLGTLATISAGALTLAGTAPFPTSNPVVTSQHQNTISSLTSFAESSTLTSGTSIQYQLVLNAIPYWYNAVNASWAVADGTFATSNTASVINSHASTLFSSLNLITNQFLGLNIFLSTTNTSNAPILTSNTIGYTWTNANPSVINQCLISGYLSDLAGNNPVPTSSAPVSLLVSCDRAFFHGNHLVEPFTKTFAFSNSGVLSASVIETATPGVRLNFSLTWYDGNSLRSAKLFNAIVPNQANINISNLSTIYPYDFG